jgi:hypothetical protein
VSKNKSLETAVIEFEKQKRILKGVAADSYRIVVVELLMEILATLRRIERKR